MFELTDQVTKAVYPCPLGVTLHVGRSGSEPAPEIPVDDHRVSRKHCAIVAEDQGLRVTDQSTYGTYINGHKLEPSGVAREGDKVQLGAHYEFVVSRRAGLPERIAGRYRVVRELAQGGMGLVLEGFDEQEQRRCAIKLVRGNRLKPEGLARFKREAEVGQRLAEHPGIVPVWEAGALDTGEPFYVMEFVEGISLTERIVGGLQQDDAVRLLAEVARAVSFAHGKGVIHRDLKPQNVIVTPDDRARLTDFGVAKALDGEDDLTATGAVVGTVTYMSPEQVQDSKRVDERTDVYGLGSLLYAALCARPPLDLRGLSMRDALDKVLAHEVPRPIHVLGTSRIDPYLDSIVMKAIALDPGERHPSAAAFADELEAWRGGKRDAPPPPPAAKDEEPDALLILVALIGLGILGFLGLLAYALLR
ncbi:MAG TPA: hypothetical protein DEA08_25300 [Planctomycetes bacterium]|nr:hypothetical protein [Planctomycetota bacterium]